MFGRKKRATSASPVTADNAVGVTVPDGDDARDVPARKRGPVKCALLAMRDWAAYYAVMIALCMVLEPVTGGLTSFVIAALIQPVAAYIIGRQLMKRRPEGTVHKIPRRRVLLLVLAYMIIIIPAKIACRDLALVAGSSYGGPMIDMLMLVLVAPVSEELLFRGVLFPLAERRTGFWPAAIMNAVVFALVHFPNVGNMVTSVTMSIVACALQSMTGRTRYGIMVHWTFNTLNVPLVIINPLPLPPVVGMVAIVIAGTAQVLFCVKRDAVARKLIPGRER